MAKYQKVKNCGPVPYPDRSGKFLLDGETAEGDDWEPLVALGFIVKVEEVAAPVKADPPKIEEPKAAILPEETAKEASDGEMQHNDGGGTEDGADSGESDGSSSSHAGAGRVSRKKR